MALVYSFFDYTGHAVRPWAEAGHVAHCFDLQHVGTRIERVGKGLIVYHHADLSADSLEWEALAYSVPGKVAMVFGFPPCTDLAVSGARHFAAKAAVDPLFQAKAVAMAKRVAWFAERVGAPYLIENPNSVLSTLWRKPDHSFNPCDFGGYLPEDDQHPRWPQYIAARDAYTKLTCLWTGNGFRMPEVDRVEPEVLERVTKSGRTIRGSRQFMKLGGSSMKTKNIRNETPRGFAQAVFVANSGAALAEEA